MTHNNNRNHVSMKQLSLAIALSLTTAMSFAQGGPGFGGPQGGPGMGGPGMGRPGGPGMMGMGPGMGLPPIMMLVQMPDVQIEINMSNAQRHKLGEIMEANRPEGGPGFGGNGGRQGQGRQGQGQGRQGQGRQGQGRQGQGGQGNFDPEAMHQRREEMDRKVLAVFNQGQSQRLRQLQLQLAGAGALFETKIQQELGLSQAQITKLSDLREELRPQGPGRQGQGRQGGPGFGGPGQGGQGQRFGDNGSGQGRQGGPGFGGPGGPGMDPEQRKKNDAKLLAVLTDAQRTKFKAMQGKAFEFRGPGGPGGPGGRQG